MKYFLILLVLVALAIFGGKTYEKQQAQGRLNGWRAEVHRLEELNIQDGKAFFSLKSEPIRGNWRLQNTTSGMNGEFLEGWFKHLQEYDLLMLHKPDGLALTLEEQRLKDEVHALRLEFYQEWGRFRGDPEMQKLAPRFADLIATPPPLIPRATPDSRQVAADIARRYGAKTTP